MKKIIALVPFFTSLTFVPSLLASKYHYIYKQGDNNFLRIDNDSISKIDEYMFANGIYRSPKDSRGLYVNFIFDCKNKKFIEDRPQYTKQIAGISFWDHKNISSKPIWEEVKSDKDLKVFNYVCNY